MSRSIPNISGIGRSDVNITEPHGVVKYPYKTDKYDEVNCDPGDTILLKKEIDDQWIYGTNTRTGHSGILPISFLHVKIPLAPTQTATKQNSMIIPDLFTTPTLSNNADSSSASYLSTGDISTTSALSNSFSSYTSSM